MSLTGYQIFHLRKFIKELAPHRGRHTELVSVYVPAGYDLNKIIQHLQQEQGTASNIKSSATRNNVIDALERMIQHLKLVQRTPKNGLAAFSGNVAEREGQSDVRVWSIEPPIPIQMRLYRCDKQFVLEPIEEMLQAKESYGMVVMDRRDATIALLRGKTMTVLTKTHSEVPGKFKAGGQSAHRFSENRELAAKAHYKKVAEHMKEQFLMMPGLQGIIVGGPGPTKYELVEGGFITNDVQKKIIAVKDITYTDEFGLQELLERSADVLAAEEVSKEKKIVSQFLELLGRKPGMVAYGEANVRKVLEGGVVDVLLLSETLHEDKISEFEAIAERYKTDVRIISTETREGAQLRDLGKYGAILRYEAHQE